MSGDLFQCVITLASSVVVTSTPSALIVDSPLIVSTLAGAVGTGALTNATGTAANFNIPSGIAIDGSGNLFIADYNNNAIREVTPAGVVTTPYGSASGTAGANNGTGNAALFTTPNGIAFDGSNGQSILYVADTGNNLIRKISGGFVSTFSTGSFNLPEGVAVDSSGNVYVADTGNNTIRKITAQGTVTTLAGVTGTAGYSDGAAGSALFNAPSALAVDASGNVYVADFGNSVIRKISGSTVSTVAGQAHVGGYLDGPKSAALFNTPSGVAVDSAGNVYVADCLVPALNTNATGNDLIRKISPAGVVSTLAGQAGNEGSANGTGAAASFYSVQAVALNSSTGTFYFADTYNQTIRQGTILSPVTLSITATQPLAQVFGTVPGVFTVTRTGGDPSAAVTANYTVGGTAVEAQDYTPALPGTLTIPVGETAQTITITPVEYDPATANPTLTLSLSPSTLYALGNSASATVTIQEITPFQTWTSAQFGANATVPSVAGETADPNHNGVPNLLEYAFGANPLQTGTEPLPTVTTALGSDNQPHLEITFNQLTGTTGLTYTVQVSADLVTWSSGAGVTTLVAQTPNGSGINQVTVMDDTPVPATGQRFIRVQVGEAQ
jgi:sugar lactone lactonase YvrE